jgi:hypothetical protein
LLTRVIPSIAATEASITVSVLLVGKEMAAAGGVVGIWPLLIFAFGGRCFPQKLLSTSYLSQF